MCIRDSVIDGLVRHTALKGFVYAESALGVLYMQVLNDFLGGQLFKVGQDVYKRQTLPYRK